MSDEFIGVIHATRPRYMKGASDMTLRRRLFLAKLKSKGRVTYNWSGDECKWQLEFSQPPVNLHGDGAMLDFGNHDAFRQLTRGWGGYSASDSITMKQREMNKGAEALINLYQTKQNRLMKALQNSFCGELYKDSASRDNAVDGVETFCGAATVAATDIVAGNDDSYAGIDTDQANQGGVWSANLTTFPNATLATDWPDGQGDSEYDFLSAKLVNWSSSNWGTGLTTWEANCWRAIGQTITWLTTTGGEDGMPDVCVLPTNLFNGYKNHEEAIRRITVPHKGSDDLGFKGNVLNQDGCGITSDFDCPANTGYMFNTSTIEIRSLMPELFWMKGPDEEPRSGYSILWACGFYGQVAWQPKYVAKLKNLA